MADNDEKKAVHHSESLFSQRHMTYATYLLGAFQLVLVVFYGLFGGSEVIKNGHYRFVGTGTQAYNMFIGVEIMMFIGFGYLMTFMKWYGLGAVGFTMLVTAMGLQWAVFTESFWGQIAFPSSEGWHNVSFDMYSLLNALYAISAVLITFGALIGKITPLQLVIITIVELFLHSFNYEVLMIKVMNLADMGGTYVDHMFGAYFGLAVTWVLGKPKTAPGMGVVPDIFSFIGTTFLWVYWPSFVAGAAEADSPQQERALVNTILALAACTVTTFFASCVFLPEKKFRPVDIQNATLAGGVAIGCTANLNMGTMAAALIGIAASLISTLGYHKIQPYLEEKWNLHDTCGVHNLHAMPSVVGAIASVIVAGNRSRWFRSNEAIYGQDNWDSQWWRQLVAIPLCVSFAVITGLITGKLISYLSPNTTDHSTEDIHEFHDLMWWEVATDYDAVVTKGQIIEDIESHPHKEHMGHVALASGDIELKENDKK